MLPTPTFNTEKLSSLQPFHVQQWGHNITSYTNQWCRRHSDFLFVPNILHPFIRKSYQSFPRTYPKSHLFLSSPCHLSCCSYLSLPWVASTALSHLPVSILASITTTVHRLQIRLLKCKPDHTPPLQ